MLADFIYAFIFAVFTASIDLKYKKLYNIYVQFIF